MTAVILLARVLLSWPCVHESGRAGPAPHLPYHTENKREIPSSCPSPTLTGGRNDPEVMRTVELAQHPSSGSTRESRGLETHLGSKVAQSLLAHESA